MLILKKYQRYTLSVLATAAFLFLGLLILTASLFQANRHQSVSIKQISTDIFKAYTGK